MVGESMIMVGRKGVFKVNLYGSEIGEELPIDIIMAYDSCIVYDELEQRILHVHYHVVREIDPSLKIPPKILTKKLKNGRPGFQGCAIATLEGKRSLVVSAENPTEVEYIALDNISSGVPQVLGKLNLEHVHPLVGQIGSDIYVVGGVWHCWWFFLG